MSIDETELPPCLLPEKSKVKHTFNSQLSCWRRQNNDKILIKLADDSLWSEQLYSDRKKSLQKTFLANKALHDWHPAAIMKEILVIQVLNMFIKFSYFSEAGVILKAIQGVFPTWRKAVGLHSLTCPTAHWCELLTSQSHGGNMLTRSRRTAASV